MSLNILCVDTSTQACSVAILRQSEITQRIFNQFIIAPREHTLKILPMVHAVLKDAGLLLSAIDIIAYGQGPGSFTGVRIGVSIAQGLAFGIDKKMVGVSTLQAMAQQAYALKNVSAVYSAIDARMGEVYFAHYQRQNNLMVLIDEELVIKPDDLINKMTSIDNNAVLVGSAWAVFPQLKAHFSLVNQLSIECPSAKYMLDQAVLLVKNKQAVAPEFAIPVYLRDKVTWKKLPGR
ncbi:MAG: tRNA (adenosine(37)-N6)-threonylcarbamoyltransferase complex dimerization subunit type 1 TsaB [Psychromonas sp.]|nr:tRNA (adenosine(37)-N6)-threonylcarbamoyltransferase complex dimerization subunit type 1 TsaB [Psychromonas sp.]